jgi:hypothetical protein
MQTIDDPGDALAVLHDPAFVVPPVPAATHGVAWLRATVGRFSTGGTYTRRRALSESMLSTVDPEALRAAAASSPQAHPVQLLATALGLDSSPGTIGAVRTVAAAYQPGTGDDATADIAVRTLVDTFGGTTDEATAAQIGLLVQACDATTVLIVRARTAAPADRAPAAARTDPAPAAGVVETAGADSAEPAAAGVVEPAAAGVVKAGVVEAAVDLAEAPAVGVVEPAAADLGEAAAAGVAEPAGDGSIVASAAAILETVLRDTPPVPATKRMATRPSDLGGTHVEPGEVVRVSLHGIPFGDGPRRCPGRAHALALAEGALSATTTGAVVGGE